MTAKNRRICHEIQNKRVAPVSGGLLHPLCWSTATTATISSRNSLWSVSPSKRVVVVALDQHRGYKGPPLTGTIFEISWQIPWFIAVIKNSHTFPYILNPPTPPPQTWAACVSGLLGDVTVALSNHLLWLLRSSIHYAIVSCNVVNNG